MKSGRNNPVNQIGDSTLHFKSDEQSEFVIEGIGDKEPLRNAYQGLKYLLKLEKQLLIAR